MAEVAAAPALDAMPGIEDAVNAASGPSTAVPPAEPDNLSETLYIQNLNEKIKIDGSSLPGS